MAKVAVVTTSGVVKGASGTLWAVNVTKVGTGASACTVYDNASAASGGKLYDGDGLIQGSFQLNDGNGGGATASQGIYVSLAGTTNPTAVIVYD